MKLSLVGAAGKMGKALTSEVQQNKEFEITNYVVKPNSFLVGKEVGSIHLNEKIDLGATVIGIFAGLNF